MSWLQNIMTEGQVTSQGLTLMSDIPMAPSVM